MAAKRPFCPIHGVACAGSYDPVRGCRSPAPKRKRAKRSPFVAAPVKRLTDNQKRMVKVVARLTRELGRAPSAADVGTAVGMTRLGARRLLKALEAHGLLSDVPVVVSSGQWALTDAGAALLEEE